MGLFRWIRWSRPISQPTPKPDGSNVGGVDLLMKTDAEPKDPAPLLTATNGVGESVEENPVAAQQMDQVQPVIVEEETIKKEDETAQTPKRSRRVAAAAKANTPKMDDNVQGDLKTPAATPIRTLRTLTTDGTNVETVDMFIKCPCNVARIRITPCFKAVEVPAAVVPAAITAGSAAKRRRGGRRPGIISTDAALSPRRRTLRRLRKNI
jgi:hypothetical protein